MAEVGVSVAAKLAEYLVHPTLQHLQYWFCVGKITRNVEIRKEELILKQGRVQELVQEAINRTERIDDEVNTWKNDVECLIAELEKLEEELRANNGCLRGLCPTWRRYCLCKKLAKTARRMIDLNTKCGCFSQVSHPSIPPNIEYRSSQNFRFFNSTQIAFDQLWEALQDDDSSMIGIRGMGGSGKTSLMRAVGKKAEESRLFNRVVFTAISQSPNTKKIQGEIADALGLKLKEESETGRAKRIALRLQSEERILIILDDLWAVLNLEDIGIPMGGNHQRSFKVVLTTRSLDVCILMECQKRIQLNLLKEDEAWTLFQTHANVSDATKEDIARQIAMECKGLPIAIVAVGTCLKEKGVDDMKVMLYQLRNAKPTNVNKGVRDAFTCLKLSYDNLATREAKLLLLMCAMFPEDHNIGVEDLFRYGVGLGLCEDVDSFEIARSQVKVTINYLINSSLLMHSSNFNTNSQKYVIMHDVVRDFALWKASEEDRTIKVNCRKELNELFADEVVKNCYAVSSWYKNNKLFQFPSQLDAPKLEFLLLHCQGLLDISDASFEGIEGLKALIIRSVLFRPMIRLLLPQSIQHLSNLRTLRLQGCNLGDISFVVSLARLEILDLQRSMFERMPNGIENLNKLKLLDLSDCKIGECCYKVIGRCSQLEELYVSKHFRHSKNANCYEYLAATTTSMKLRRYRLEIGRHEIQSISHDESTRYLCLGQLNISMLGARIKDLAQIATAIEFHELEGGSRSFMPNVVHAIGGMNELSKLYLTRCSEMECITDKIKAHEDAIVPRLDELVLRYMDNLQQLHRGLSSFSLFQKLERLRISSCPQLLHIFPADCNIGNLKFLDIFGCPRLTSLFPVSAVCTLLSLQGLRIERCSELKHVIEGQGGGDAWENLRFPKLKILFVDDCCKLESVCSVFLAQRFVQLQRLSITNAPQMKFVFSENANEEQPLRDQDETQIALSLLEYLTLTNLPNLVGICSERYHLRWPSIKTIEWKDCPNLELESHRRNEEHKSVTTIESIKIHNCGVESISLYKAGVEEQYPTFQSLKELVLGNHARLKFVFSAHMFQSLPELTSVAISRCEELEAIFSENEETQKNLSNAESCLPKLKSLVVSECNKLKFVLSFMIGPTASMLPQLSTLTISNSSQMEEIFKCSNIEDHHIDSSEKEITFPNMKYLELDNLPRLVNVCQGFKFQTGEFYTVKVHECPKFMPIMGTSIHWTKKGLVREHVLKYNQLNNNEALNLPLSVLNAGELDIRSPRVEQNWRVIGDDEEEETNNSGMLRSEKQMVGGLVPTQVLSFQHLHSLEVTHNKRLKFLFSRSTIVHTSLPKLASLILSDCEELEEIIATNEEHQIMSSAEVHFPELRKLKVERCNKLKRLFSTSTGIILPQLCSLSIAEANQLEVIFRHSSEGDSNYNDTIVLSSLRIIQLINLPNLKSVCRGLQMQAHLSYISIPNCPTFVDSTLGKALQQLGTISVSTENSNVQTSSNEEKELPVNEEKGTVVISGAEYLYLKDSMNLKIKVYVPKRYDHKPTMFETSRH
ncbi:disease resistance protein At4g27190-like [Neltuma alba]|uniref:disease resistance protein At4g27190-like n=1 Tax=Neltuma alba TaxID=207710 RepID=UPI0010A51019|nr:disease resistance protein At4g27190-like [Prosopis alba]